MNRSQKEWLIKAVFTGLVLVLIGWFIQNGINNRPIINYRFDDCPKEMRVNYWQEQTQQSVALGILNSGNTDSAIILHFKGQNIDISNETKKPYWTINGTDVYINYLIKQSSQYTFEQRIYFMVNKSTENFSYSYDIIKNSDISISGIINRLFGEIKGIYPTVCKYQRQADSGFIRYVLT